MRQQLFLLSRKWIQGCLGYLGAGRDFFLAVSASLFYWVISISSDHWNHGKPDDLDDGCRMTGAGALKSGTNEITSLSGKLKFNLVFHSHSIVPCLIEASQISIHLHIEQHRSPRLYHHNPNTLLWAPRYPRRSLRATTALCSIQFHLYLLFGPTNWTAARNMAFDLPNCSYYLTLPPTRRWGGNWFFTTASRTRINRESLDETLRHCRHFLQSSI
jgi:hypothetical protein